MYKRFFVVENDFKHTRRSIIIISINKNNNTTTTTIHNTNKLIWVMMKKENHHEVVIIIIILIMTIMCFCSVKWIMWKYNIPTSTMCCAILSLRINGDLIRLSINLFFVSAKGKKRTFFLQFEQRKKAQNNRLMCQFYLSWQCEPLLRNHFRNFWRDDSFMPFSLLIISIFCYVNSSAKHFLTTFVFYWCDGFLTHGNVAFRYSLSWTYRFKLHAVFSLYNIRFHFKFNDIYWQFRK